jgi:hypothetical protein
MTNFIGGDSFVVTRLLFSVDVSHWFDSAV